MPLLLSSGQVVAALASAFVLAVTLNAPSYAEKRYAPVDPSWNTNNNKPGTPCHKQMSKVRKLEFDPRFDSTKAIREEWAREMAVARQMNCQL